MMKINPINLNNKQITFIQNNNDNCTKVGLMSLDKNPGNKINFEKDLYITVKADPVQSNPLKAIAYNIVKAYNILRAPQKSDKYIHIPYMA